MSFSYVKGPLIKIFQTDAPYGCIMSFVRHYMNFLSSDLFIIRASYESM